MSVEMIEVQFKCTRCGAVDIQRIDPTINEHPWPTMNCYQCHAGQGMDRASMLQQGVGMFPPSWDGWQRMAAAS